MGHDEELKSLDEAIAAGTGAQDRGGLAALYFRRGKLLYRTGEFGRAKNDFLKVSELLSATQPPPEYEDAPEDIQKSAAEYITMIENILEFRYTDTYNP